MRCRTVAPTGGLRLVKISQLHLSYEGINMNTKYFCLLTLLVGSFAATASAASCGSNHGANNPYNSPYGAPYPAMNLNPSVAPGGPFGVANPAANFAPSAPQSRLSVVPGTPTLSPSTGTAASAANTATLHVIPDTDATATPKTSPKIDPALTKPLDATVSTKAAPKEDDSKIADELKGLVGTWMAVARHGDGALTTVELQLDSKGWAKLTVPGANGEPSTITRRVELNDKELKLTGPEGALALGKLVEFNSRQLVLDRDGGQVTFVRP
jgi:hypothetical protein